MNTMPQVLLAFADSNAASPLRNLSLENEAIRGALAPLIRDKKLVEPTILWNATADHIADELQKDYKEFRVFHFGGHAKGNAVVLADLQGERAEGHAKGLADFLGQQKGLELVFLNGCSTQAQIDRLRAVGIEAVVATTRAIVDRVAAEFAARFYKGLIDKPLQQAFDEASGAVRFKEGEPGVSRTLVDDERADPDGWKHALPWVLSCSKEMEGWWLVPRPKYDKRKVVAVLARLFFSESDARFVASRAGLPREEDPPFPTALLYWDAVVGKALDGAIKGGIEALLDEANHRFPYSEDLAELRGSGS